jgi:ABC-type phosphate/phosphonate transport system substrate-binding protein
MKNRIANALASMALIATAVAQTVAPSNATIMNPRFGILTGSAAQNIIAALNPLTDAATNLGVRVQRLRSISVSLIVP